RGIDIDQLPHVANFELPNVPEDYVHRIGRTGRAGSAGAAMSLVDRSEIKLLDAIEKLIKRPIERTTIQGWTPDMVKAEPAHVRARNDDQPRRTNAPRRNGNAAGGNNGAARSSARPAARPQPGNGTP